MSAGRRRYAPSASIEIALWGRRTLTPEQVAKPDVVYKVPCGGILEFQVGEVTVHVTCDEQVQPPVEPPDPVKGGFGALLRADFDEMHAFVTETRKAGRSDPVIYEAEAGRLRQQD